jgi:plastocyanin
MGKRLFIIFTVIAVGLGILFVNQPTVNAQESQIITIHDGEDSVTIHPKTVTISKGTCVIWLNWSTTTDVNIAFEQGKVCKDVVEASMDFKLDKESCFISNVILTKGGTASLVYEKEGSFDYAAKSKDGKAVNGKIIVQ